MLNLSNINKFVLLFMSNLTTNLIMPIDVKLSVILAKRKVSLNELSEKVGISIQNLSILKTGRAKAIRFSTLNKICEVLKCQPGELLEYIDDLEDTSETET